jgi:excisionase family DNA binding protein
MKKLELYSVKETASMFGVAYATMRKMIARGEVKVAVIGRAKKIPAAEIERLAQGAFVEQ